MITIFGFIDPVSFNWDHYEIKIHANYQIFMYLQFLHVALLLNVVSFYFN